MEAAAHIGSYKEDVEADGHIVATEGRCRDRWSHCSYRGKVWRQVVILHHNQGTESLASSLLFIGSRTPAHRLWVPPTLKVGLPPSMNTILESRSQTHPEV